LFDTKEEDALNPSGNIKGVKLWTATFRAVDENASSPSGNSEGVNSGLQHAKL